VLLHGLTATRRYLVMGSRLLERSGVRVIAYDARGHGESTPAPRADCYGYDQLAGDLCAVLDRLEVDQALLAGASMGAHTALRMALEHPGRVRALCLITPAYDPRAAPRAEDLAQWDALARALRERGVEGFVNAYDLAAVDERWRATVQKVLRQRLAAHRHPNAVADALQAVPRSRPFGDLDELAQIGVPTVVVASRDAADPGHPFALAQLYAQAIDGAQLIVEGESDASPIAWRGGALSRIILELSRRA
jgi:pimeloyl-ACP methyl ester carboxylesterase